MATSYLLKLSSKQEKAALTEINRMSARMPISGIASGT